MKKKMLLAIIIIILIILIAYIAHNLSSNDTNPRHVNIEKISKEEYIKALNQYCINPILNGFRKEISFPGDDAEYFYKITVKDEGYNEKIPIDVEVFFSSDKYYNMIEDSFFSIKDNDGYRNLLIFMGDHGKDTDEVYLDIIINVVLDDYEDSNDYEYRVSLSFKLPTLENTNFIKH